jgi:protein deglycase
VLIDLLKQQKHQDKWYGAICAAPAVVLYAHGLLPSPATGYPGFEKDLDATIDYRKHDRVVVTGKCVTSQGPGTAMEMGVKLIELLCGKDKADAVAKGLLMP